MDTIVGKDGHGSIVTLTERSTNMLLMRKLNKGKNAKELARTVIHLLAPFKGCVTSITTDNGTDFACHAMIAKSIGTKKKDIAKAINVSPSTISREIKRNSGHNGHYNWETAQRNVAYRKHKKPGNRSIDDRVKNEAIRLLTEEQ